MTITYFLRVVAVSPVFSKKLAHIEPKEDRSKWLLVALYKKWQVAHLVTLDFTIFGPPSLPPMEGGSGCIVLVKRGRSKIYCDFVKGSSLSEQLV